MKKHLLTITVALTIPLNASGTTFHIKHPKKDESGNFMRGQIPLIKPLTQNGELKAMEVCTCGGTPEEYVKCVSENCEDYRFPTRYEYCKLGSEHNKIGCFHDQIFHEDNSGKCLVKGCKCASFEFAS